MAFQLPESLEGLSVSELTALIDEALDEYNTVRPTDESTDEQIDAAEVLGEAIKTLTAARTAEEAVVQARLDRIAKLNADVEAATTPEPDAPPEEPPPPPDPANPDDVIKPDEVIAPDKQPVAAGGGKSKSPVRRAAANAPAPVIPPKPRVSLLAAADVPGFSNGQHLDDLDAVTAAILSRTRGLPRTNLATAAGGVRMRYGAALIRKEGYGDLVQDSTGAGDMALIAAAGDQSRLPGGSLTAAGGWCAPSQTLYDLCQLETVEGIIDVPEMQITRGGIRWTPGPDWIDIYNECGFFQTEADAIAGECKDCCQVSCPPFDEIRLDLIGLCVKSPILTEHAYPELVRRFLEGALVAQQHKVNKYIIDAIVAAAGTPAVAADAGSVSITLNALEYVALGMRYSYRLGQTAPIEVLLPFWFKTQVRNDLAMMNGQDRTRRVSDAEVNGWFTDRNLRVQWLYDMQDPTVDRCNVVLPATVTAALYPAGTWTKGSADVISLDAVYDSPNLEANQYTALFVEEGILAVQRCTHTCAVTLPVCVSGKGVVDEIDLCLATPTGGGTLP